MFHRCCWHINLQPLIQKMLLPEVKNIHFKRTLRLLCLLHSHYITRSRFRALPNIPHCCLYKRKGVFQSPCGCSFVKNNYCSQPWQSFTPPTNLSDANSSRSDFHLCYFLIKKNNLLDILFLTLRQIIHVLLTFSPLQNFAILPFDLHVLSIQQTFNLSQD